MSLDVESGALTMILGRSGSGKTTLLKLIDGLLKPSRGSVRIASEDTTGTVAYVPQNLGLVRSLSALDNTLTGALRRVGTARSLLRLFPKSLDSQARETLARLGLHDKVHQPVHRLSGGERQRVAIARALMQRPALILADEFVSQLDPISTMDILEQMRAIAREQGLALLITTHEIDVAEAYADRVVVMAKGNIVHRAEKGAITRADLLGLLE